MVELPKCSSYCYQQITPVTDLMSFSSEDIGMW